MVSDHELKIFFFFKFFGFELGKEKWEKASWKLHTLHIAFTSGRDHLRKDDQNLEEIDKLAEGHIRAKPNLHL